VSEFTYSGKLRVRVAALIFKRGSLLLVKQHVPTLQEDVWMPPGGGVNFGEKLEEALCREVKEETRLEVKPKKLQFIHEYYQNRHHAIEFYFYCESDTEKPEIGIDPEHDITDQSILDVKFLPLDNLNQYKVFPRFIREEVSVLVGRKDPIKFHKTWL